MNHKLQELYTKVIQLFKANPPLAHDYKHAVRTAKFAKMIAESVHYDTEEAEVAGLLHDVGRTIDNTSEGHGPRGLPLAKELMDTSTRLSEEAKKRILHAIEVHSDPESHEQLDQILQDADKLDGLGAQGLARAFISHYHLPDYDPEHVIPTDAAYGAAKTITEQILVQLRWYDMLYTEKAKAIAKPRYEYMKGYFEELKREVEETE